MDTRFRGIVDKLKDTRSISRDDFTYLLTCTGEEAAECIAGLRDRVKRIGFHVADSRGDHPDFIS